MNRSEAESKPRSGHMQLAYSNGNSFEVNGTAVLTGQARAVFGLSDLDNKADNSVYSTQRQNSQVSKAAMSESEITDLKIKALTAELNGQLGRFEERINIAISDMKESSAGLRADIRQTSRDLDQKIEDQKKSIWGAAAVTIATVLAGYAMIFQAFDTGRDTAAMTEQAAQSVKAASELLGRVQSKLDEQSKPTTLPDKPAE